MAATSQMRNGWETPQLSFPLDLSQAAIERTTNDRQCPSISLSLGLSQTSWLSPEKREREDLADISYGTDFEFCVIGNNNNNGGQNSVTGESHLAVADELSVDSEILPLIKGHVEAEPAFIARRDVSLESLKCGSPVRSTAAPPSKITNNCWGNVASKSLRHNPPGKWNELMFELSNKKNVFADHNRRSTSCKTVDQSGNILKQQPSPTKSMWSFSRIGRTGGEMEGNSLFRSSPFSRRHSTAECKYKPATAGFTSKDTENLPSLAEVSKPLEAWSMSNKIQTERQFLGQLKPRNQAEKGKAEKCGRDKLSSPGLPAVKAGMIGRSSGRVGAVRNMGSSGSHVSKAAILNSPPPGKAMAEGYFRQKENSSIGRRRVRVSPVVNVRDCMGHSGGRWKGGGGHFTFFSGRDKKQPQP